MTRSVSSVLVLALLCAVGTWFVSHRSTQAPHFLPPALERQSDPAPNTALEPRGERAASPDAGATRAELAALETLQLPFEGAAATLELHVVDATRKQPVPEAAIRLSAQAADEWEELTARGNPPLTDGGGRISLRVPAGRALSAEISGTWVRTEPRRHELALLAPEELRTDVLEVATEEDLHFFGAVLDAGTRAPLADVEIQLERRPSIEPIAVSDASGRFELRTNSWESRKASASKRGFQTLAFTIDEQHESRSRPQQLALARAATIQGLYRDCEDRPLPQGSLRFWTRSGFAAHVYPREDGWFEADSLPVGEPIDVDLELEHRPLARSVASVVLAPGELRRLDCKLPRVFELRGVVQDELGAPVAGCELALYAGSAADLRCLRGAGALDERESATSDAEGRFVFGKATQGDWVVAALRIGGGRAFLRERTSASIPLAAQNVALTGEQPEPLVLRCWTKLSIAGRVVDTQDQPVPHARVELRLAGCGLWREFWTRPDGGFSMSVPGPDAYELCVTGTPYFPGHETITARGGEQSVVLRLKRAPLLQLRIQDERSLEPARAQVFGVQQAAADPAPRILARTELGGRLQIPCEAGTYRLFARADDGRCGTLDDVALEQDAPARTWTVSVAPGKRVRVRASAAGGLIEVEFRWNGIPIDELDIEPGSSVELSMPNGTLGARYRRVEPPGEWRTLDAQIDDSAPLEIDLPFR